MKAEIETVGREDIHIITDCISLEHWWTKENQQERGDYMAYPKGVRVAKCPIGLEYCYPSCYWRKGNRCYYRSKRGRQIPELKKKDNN